MATGTFTYNTLRAKTLKDTIKTQRKIVSHSNLTTAMLLVQERLQLNHIFPHAQWAQFGSQVIVIKCTAAIFFLTVDCECTFRTELELACQASSEKSDGEEECFVSS